MNVTLHLPDQLGKKLTEMPDYERFAERALRKALADKAALEQYHQEKIEKGIQAAREGRFAEDQDVEAFFDQWK